MKARFIAMLLSIFVITYPAHSGNTPEPSLEKKPPTIVSKIDLNHADLATLTGSFKGIGKKRAEAIIAYRDSHQGFKSLEELAEVKGIGQHFVEANREKLEEIYLVN